MKAIVRHEDSSGNCLEILQVEFTNFDDLQTKVRQQFNHLTNPTLFYLDDLDKVAIKSQRHLNNAVQHHGKN